MTQTVLLLLTFLFACVLASSNKWACTDYYWRDYHGFIPDDAIPAGNDHNGNPRYIGLVYIRGFEFLPATILPKQEVAQTTAYSHVLNTSQHVKILCSPHKEAFEWIHVESKDLKDYTGRNLIPGGSEVGESLYIGRVFKDNDVIIGKIFRHERSNKGIWFTNGSGIFNLLVYEVLSYNCDNVKRPNFDVRAQNPDKQSDIELVY